MAEIFVCFLIGVEASTNKNIPWLHIDSQGEVDKFGIQTIEFRLIKSRISSYSGLPQYLLYSPGTLSNDYYRRVWEPAR